MSVSAAWRAERNIDDVVDAEDIAEVISSWTGVPVQRMLETEAERLLKMEERLHQRIVGQDDAIAQIVNIYQTFLAGMSSPGRPIGNFLFLGPTGTGKTKTIER